MTPFFGVMTPFFKSPGNSRYGSKLHTESIEPGYPILKSPGPLSHLEP